MNSYGDGTVRTELYETLDYVCFNHYGKSIFDLSYEEKLQFTMQVLEVLQYRMGYDDWEGIIRK